MLCSVLVEDVLKGGCVGTSTFFSIGTGQGVMTAIERHRAPSTAASCCRYASAQADAR
jgi:hypothetical protein